MASEIKSGSLRVKFRNKNMPNIKANIKETQWTGVFVCVCVCVCEMGLYL